jgi:hypothetical protein
MCIEVKKILNVILVDYIIFPGKLYLSFFFSNISSKLRRAILTTPMWIRVKLSADFEFNSLQSKSPNVNLQIDSV